MTLADPGHKFALYDEFGNPTPSTGKLVVPLDGLGYYVRTDGSKGSFQPWLRRVRTARN